MKTNILFFILFAIFILADNAFSLPCYDPWSTGTTSINSFLSSNPGFVSYDPTGVTTSYAIASNAKTTFLNAMYSKGQQLLSHGSYYFDTSNHAGYFYIRYYDYPTTGDFKKIAVWPFSDGVQFTTNRCSTDSDNDGIPDSTDLKPYDATPYTGKLTKVITDSTGKVVWYTIELNDGTICEFGTIPSSPEGCIYKTFDNSNSATASEIATAITNAGLERSYSHSISEIGTDGKLIEDDLGKWMAGYKPPDPVTGGPNDITTTPKPNVNDTDSTLLGEIANNTSSSLDNDRIISGLLKEINANIVKGNNHITEKSDDKPLEVNFNPNLNLDPLLNQNTQNRAADNSEAQGHQSTAESWSPESNYPSSKYNGNLTKGPGGDYEDPGNLGNENWFSSFVTSNPLVSALHNSGFQSSGSICEMTLNLGSLGTHHLSLCEFQSEFAAAGNLLLAFCGLTSLIIVVRG